MTFEFFQVKIVDAVAACKKYCHKISQKINIQGAQPHGKPGKVQEFHIGQGKSHRNCGLPVVCYCSCDSLGIDIT